MIENLPSLSPNPSRAARTVARCHDRMALHRRRLESAATPSPRGTSVERILVGGVSVIYLAAVAAVVLQVLMRA